MKKTYILRRSMSLTTSFVVDGQSQIVEFKGGFDSESFRRNGIYTTTHENMQKAIESDASYGKLFVLVGEEKKAEAPVDDFIDLMFTKVQECREYLLANVAGLTEECVPNKAKVIEVGLANKIRFPKLK